MWWSRGLAAVCCALALAACGFQPLYMKNEGNAGVTDDLAQVKILNVRADKPEYDRLGQQMHNLLRQRLTPQGGPATPRYTLESRISVSVERTGIQITEEATRARLTVYSSFALRKIGDTAVLYRGSERSTNSFNVANSQFATLTAEKDAAQRAVREISEAIRLRLAMYFQRVRGD